MIVISPSVCLSIARWYYVIAIHIYSDVHVEIKNVSPNLFNLLPNVVPIAVGAV